MFYVQTWRFIYIVIHSEVTERSLAWKGWTDVVIYGQVHDVDCEQNVEMVDETLVIPRKLQICSFLGITHISVKFLRWHNHHNIAKIQSPYHELFSYFCLSACFVVCMYVCVFVLLFCCCFFSFGLCYLHAYRNRRKNIFIYDNISPCKFRIPRWCKHHNIANLQPPYDELFSHITTSLQTNFILKSKTCTPCFLFQKTMEATEDTMITTYESWPNQRI